MPDDSSSKPHPFDVQTVQFLVRLMSEHELHEIDLREGDQRIRLLRGAPVVAPPTAPLAHVAPPTASAPAPVPVPATAPATPSRPTIEIKSESVGTFYIAPEPGAPPYVAVGSRITPTTVIGQIEAMKLFTQIPAGVSGVITEVLVKNEQFVDYNYVLFRVDPNA